MNIGVLLGCFSLAINAAIGGAGFKRFGFTPFSAAVTYFLGGTLGGAIVGLLSPLIRDNYSAALVAMAAFTPLIVIVRIVNFGGTEWSIGEALAICIFALAMGSLWGPPMWRAHVEKRKKRE